MNSWLAAILDACELPSQEKEMMRAEAQIVQALADDGTGTLQRNVRLGNYFDLLSLTNTPAEEGRNRTAQ